MQEKILKSFLSLKKYVEKKDYKGWDPYDGLTSRIFQNSFLNNTPLARLIWIQLFKRSPFNLRCLFKIPENHNAKGLGLFLSGYCNLYKISPSRDTLGKIGYLTGKIIETKSPGYSGDCWGYYFDWQARAFFQPKNTPTVVATVYVANALLDAYEILRDETLLKIARSSCDFVLKDLNRTYDAFGDFCFSYSPLDHSQVFNASLLASRLLARVFHFTREKALIEEAEKSVHFCCRHQKEDGSWPYGTLSFHQWIDNFHTGFNLECLHAFEKYSDNTAYRKNIERGVSFYLQNFFLADGRSKYYHNRLFPIDIHAPAQLVVTLYSLGVFETYKPLIDRTLEWTIQNMQNESGYFYYQIKKYFSSKTPYMRWAQSWMFLSLSTYLLATYSSDEEKESNNF